MSIIDVVVGAAFGSEGKGHITAQVVKARLQAKIGPVLNIRVAGPNAGHTVVDSKGKAFALRQVPVGAAVSSATYLYIAPGSEIDPPVLADEVYKLREAGHPVARLSISAEATILTEDHKMTEHMKDLNGRLGSTAKGIGAARADRIFRSAKRVIDDEEFVEWCTAEGIQIVDRVGEKFDGFGQRWATMNECAIVIEGTQGFGLGLHAGFYPQVTSSDCRAIDFLAMAGITPWTKAIHRLNVYLVARVHPIRVAGNSGPLKGETTWEELELPEEHTTVTHKVRRVGEWDSELVRRAVEQNGGGGQWGQHPVVSVSIALTMVDQMYPSIGGVAGTDIGALYQWSHAAPQEEMEGLSYFLDKIEQECKAPVNILATSPNTVIWRA